VEQQGSERNLVVTVKDQGQGFEPSTLSNPLAPENILNTSGRGIFLVRQFMDEVTFLRTRDGGTEVRMLKHL
jgi:serine/threonine-protein kinase RsbW